MPSELERTLEKEIRELELFRKRPVKRRLFAERIHEDLVNNYRVMLPYSVVPALEYLLSIDYSGKKYGKGVLVSGSYHTTMYRNEYRRSFPKKSKGIRYRGAIAGKSCDIIDTKLRNCPLKDINTYVEIDLHNAELFFNLGDKRIVNRVELPETDFFCYNVRGQEYLKRVQDMVAVEIREVLRNRKAFWTTGAREYLPNNILNSYMIVIYKDNQQIIFDLFGGMLFPSLSLSELAEKKRLMKTEQLRNEAGNINLEEYTNKVISYLISYWREKSDYFLNRGLSMIIQGTIEKKVGKEGYAKFDFNAEGKKRKNIYVCSAYAGNNIQVEFIGPYMFFHHNREEINAFKTTKIGFEYHIHDSALSSWEYIRIKNIDPKRKITHFYAGSKIYLFRTEDIQASAGTKGKCAIMCHKPIQGEASFNLLVSTGDGAILNEAIRPYSSLANPNYKNKSPSK